MEFGSTMRFTERGLEGWRCERLRELSSHIVELRTIRERLLQLIPHACGCRHEARIAQKYSPTEYAQERRRDRRKLALTVVCADRKENPLCAHLTDDFAADPYGKEIRRLRELGIVKASWITWSAELASHIRIIDCMAAEERYEGEFPVHSIMAAQGWDAVQNRAIPGGVYDRIMRARSKLLAHLDRVIEEVEAMHVPA